MHKISSEEIKNIIDKLTNSLNAEALDDLLEAARILYEKVVILKHQHTEIPDEIDNTLQEETEDHIIENENKQAEEEIIHSKEEVITEQKLSVQEQIKIIMEKARQGEDQMKDDVKDVVKEPEKEESMDQPQKTSLKEELKDAISADIAADLFERAEKIESKKKSLNEKLSQNQIQIGLNDRIAFVKHLFEGNQADFNRVLSQLNSFQTEIEAKNFVNTILKKEYRWDGKEEYEERFLSLIERKYM